MKRILCFFFAVFMALCLVSCDYEKPSLKNNTVITNEGNNTQNNIFRENRKGNKYKCQERKEHS